MPPSEIDKTLCTCVPVDASSDEDEGPEHSDRQEKPDGLFLKKTWKDKGYFASSIKSSHHSEGNMLIYYGLRTDVLDVSP